jgi:hypothetical protein
MSTGGSIISWVTLPGHDRDVAEAVLSQSRLKSNPISDVQVEHLLTIGYGAGIHAGEARGWQRAVAALRDLASYKHWHAEQLDATGVEHHQWNSSARRILADYLEWAATRTPEDRP